MLKYLSESIFDADGYKYGHFLQYPPGMQGMEVYMSCRGGRYGKVRFFGLQHELKAALDPITEEQVKAAELFIPAYGPSYNVEGFRKILNRYGGHWPVEVRALPEGALVPVQVPCFTITSTDPELPWVPGFLETRFRVWAPTATATKTYYWREMMRRYLEKASDDPEAELQWKLHDFGSRGVSCRAASAVQGAAHLLNFRGTDNVIALRMINECYAPSKSKVNMAQYVCGGSIDASEHSTVTS